MIDVDGHGTMDGGDQAMRISAVVLETSFNAFRLPIRPKDVVFEHGQTEDVMQRMSRAAAGDHVPVLTVQIRSADVVLTSVGPEELSRHERDCERVRPAERLVHDHLAMTSVHAHLGDVRSIAPVRPIEISVRRIYHDGSRLLQSFSNEHLAELTVQLGDFDGIRALVAPE